MGQTAIAAGPKIFIVNEYAAIPDQAAYEAYAVQVPPTLPPFGAKYITRGGKPVPLSGDAPVAVVILEFPDMESFRGWASTPEAKRLGQLRAAATVGRTYMVVGGAPD
jgi:uncharacterized protein (DUF1330 family)